MQLILIYSKINFITCVIHFCTFSIGYTLSYTMPPPLMYACNSTVSVARKDMVASGQLVRFTSWTPTSAQTAKNALAKPNASQYQSSTPLPLAWHFVGNSVYQMCRNFSDSLLFIPLSTKKSATHSHVNAPRNASKNF